MVNKYTADGVNITEGDDFSSFAAKICATTHKNSPYVEIYDLSHGHFRGPRGFRIQNLPEDFFCTSAADGIGTKVGIIDAAISHETAALDLLAMTGGDIVRWGGLPVMFSSVLDAASIGKHGDETNNRFRKLIKGLVDAANDQEIVLYTGETAELGQYVGSDDPRAVTKFNWAGFATGIYDPTRIITGDSLAPGQRVIALREHVFRSNGISSVRKAFHIYYGAEWWNNPAAQEDIRLAAAPSTSYDRLLASANGWYSPGYEPKFKIHLIAHLTGGGIKSKFAEDILFPRGLSAKLLDLWDPPEIMKRCAEWRDIRAEECYTTWNGGQGALVVLDVNDVEPFIKHASDFGIEAKDCGEITKKAIPSVLIVSKFGRGTFEIVPSTK